MTLELPELIWAWVNDPTYTHGGWSLNKELKNAPYVRGDLYQVLVKEWDEIAARVKYLEGVGNVDGKLIQKTASDAVRYKARAEQAEAEVERLRAHIVNLQTTEGKRMKTVQAYEIWRTDRAILVSPKESARKGEWITLANCEVVPAGLENRSAVLITAEYDVLRRAGLLPPEQ